MVQQQWFAHEIGHFINGDDGVRYYDSATTNVNMLLIYLQFGLF